MRGQMGGAARMANPEWVILGTDTGDVANPGRRYAVWASGSLTAAQMEVETDIWFDEYLSPPAAVRPTRSVYTLTARMEQLDGRAVIYMALGASYGEALATVMGMFDPDRGSPSRPPQIGFPVPQLPGGRP